VLDFAPVKQRDLHYPSLAASLNTSGGEIVDRPVHGARIPRAAAGSGLAGRGAATVRGASWPLGCAAVGAHPEDMSAMEYTLREISGEVILGGCAGQCGPAWRRAVFLTLC